MRDASGHVTIEGAVVSVDPNLMFQRVLLQGDKGVPALPEEDIEGAGRDSCSGQGAAQAPGGDPG